MTDAGPHPLGRTIGTVVIRVLIPIHLLIGAATKWWSASPYKLPSWMRYGAAESLSATEAESLLILLLKVAICIEVVTAGVIALVPRLSRFVAAAICATFIFVLIAEINHLAGHSSTSWADVAFKGDCGCYGTVMSVPPGVMILVDAGLICAALLLPMRQGLWPKPRHRAIATVFIWTIVGIGFGMNPRMGQHDESKFDWKEILPRYWVGKPFAKTPLGQVLELDAEFFGHDRQTWILYRTDCSVCHDYFKTHHSKPTDETVVAVRVPPLRGTRVVDGQRDITCPSCHRLDLPADRDWPISVPMVITIENGIVVNVVDVKRTAPIKHDA